MGVEIFSRAEKKRVLEELKPYGVEKLDYLLLQAGQRLRIFSGNLSKNELITFFYTVRVDNLGLYFASLKEGFRLNIDALQILQSQIKGRIFEVTDDQAEQWFRGESLEVLHTPFNPGDFVVLKNRNDLIGSGKFTGMKILNFLPKERLAR